MLASVLSAQANERQSAGAPPAAKDCRKEAALRFIQDFVQAGPPREMAAGSGIIVLSYRNDKPQRFEQYVADCLKRRE